MRAEDGLTQDIVRELLDYSPETGEFTWRERGEDWFPRGTAKAWNKRFAGKKAGSLYVRKRDGYARIYFRLFGRLRAAHRMAWIYMEGLPVPEQIDHINHDATDNRWCNIRASSAVENAKNRSRRVDNASGVAGVSWERRAGKWQAYGASGGKRKFLGLFQYDDLDVAAMEVMEFWAENGFDPGHGLEFSPGHAIRKQLKGAPR